MISSCMITYNEQEMLPYSLAFLTSIPEIKEICILDSMSTDSTLQILEIFKKKYPHIKYDSKPFVSFGEHKNEAMKMATEPYILLIDADETYSANILNLFQNIKSSQYNFVRIPTYTSLKSMKFYIDSGNLDPHIRILKNGSAFYKGDVHEVLCNSTYSDIHCANGPDILNVGDVFMKHHSLLKSTKHLLEKGERWESLGAIEKSAARGIPIHKGIWAEWKEAKLLVKDLPLGLYDKTTNLWGSIQCPNQIQQFVNCL